MGHFLKVSLKEPVYFDPGPVIAAVIDSPNVQSRAREYALNLKLDACLPEVLSDPTSFGEVLRNLLDNAFDATPAGGTVQVRGYRKSPTAFVLSVRDSGRGLTNPDKDQLFRPFFTTKENGMGLGLPFIKRVMDTCGGKVEVRSRAGKGSIFKLIFNSRERESTP
jgi:two-component system, sporulation sensor kinase E